MNTFKILTLALCLFSLAACRTDDDPAVFDTDVVDINDLGDETPNEEDDPNNGNGNSDPEDPNTGIEDQASMEELGRLLFWDPILSGSMKVSCATCHHPDFGYADGRDLSIGIEAEGLGPNRRHLSAERLGFVKRNAPTIINTAFNGMDEDGHFDPADAPMFWDNRASSLEEQALGPIQSFEEMRGHAFAESVAVETIVGRLAENEEYRTLFTQAFGLTDAINSTTLSRAIAAFERSVVATNSPFDQFRAGNRDAMTPQQISGMQRFNQIGCNNCHSGPMFSDFQLHTLGLEDNPQLDESDTGANGTYAFRTPTLRNLNETGPYFHNGIGRDLQQTIRFYITARNFARNGNGGPGLNPNVSSNQIDDEVRRLNNFNNDDIQDIIAFIRALDDPDFDREIPGSVPSGLAVGGDID